jgi:hypothetical protein
MNCRKWTLLVVTLALMALTAGLLLRLRSSQKLGHPGVRLAAQPVFDPKGKVVATNCIALPERVLDYQSEAMPVAQIVLDTLPADTTHGQRLYQAPDGYEIQLNAVLMGTDRTSIHKPQICLTGQGWKIERSEVFLLPVEQPHAYRLPVMRLITSRTVKLNDGQEVTLRGFFVYWFVAENRLTARHGERMWWMAEELLRTGVLQRWAYVTCFSVCLPGQEELTFNRMKQFLIEAVPQFQVTTGPLLKPGKTPP